MEYSPRDFSYLLGKLKISDRQLKEHFKLYEGYVRKLDEVRRLKEGADRSKVNYSYGECSELFRRESVPYNGTVLHELYFDNLAPSGQTRPSQGIKDLLRESYGSVEAWIEDMKAAAQSAHGWALTVWDPLVQKLRTNLVYSEHQEGLFADVWVVAALDAWEHAYMIDFGTSKGEYLTAFFENFNWDAFARRSGSATKALPEVREAALAR